MKARGLILAAAVTAILAGGGFVFGQPAAGRGVTFAPPALAPTISGWLRESLRQQPT